MTGNVLLGSPRDLLDLRDAARLPASFLEAVSGEGLHTYSRLRALLRSRTYVGVDSSLLVGAGLDCGHEASLREAWRRDVAQVLAHKALVLLCVFRGFQSRALGWSLAIAGGGDGPDEPAARGAWAETLMLADGDTMASVMQRLEAMGIEMTLDDHKDGQRLVLRGVRQHAGRTLAIEESCSGEGVETRHKVNLLGLRAEGEAVCSRIFPAGGSGRDESMSSLLHRCAVLAERDCYAQLHEAMEQAVAAMQGDTRAWTRVHRVVVALRDLEPGDLEVLGLVRDGRDGRGAPAVAGASLPADGVMRTWLLDRTMRITAPLEEGSAAGERVAAQHVWGQAVGLLLARLSHDAGVRDGGWFAWSGAVYAPPGISAHAQGEIESLILATLDDPGDDARLEVPDWPVPRVPQMSWPPSPTVSVDGDALGRLPARMDWHEKALGAVRAAEQAGPESIWRDDFQRDGQAFRDERHSRWIMGRDPGGRSGSAGVAAEAARGSMDEPVQRRAAFSEAADKAWRVVAMHPAGLRLVAQERPARAGFVQELKRQSAWWREHVLARRRTVAAAREAGIQHAGELQHARESYLHYGARAAIAVAVGCFAMFLALFALRALATVGGITVLTVVFTCGGALLGAWLGMVIPAWVEARQGRRAAALLGGELADLGTRHEAARYATSALMRSAEQVGRELDVLAFRRRVWSLASRAHAAALEARDEHLRRAGILREARILDEGSRSGRSDDLRGMDRGEWLRACVRVPASRRLGSEADVVALIKQAWTRETAARAACVHQAWTSPLKEEDFAFTGMLREHAIRDAMRDTLVAFEALVRDQYLDARAIDIPDAKDVEHDASGLFGLDASRPALLSCEPLGDDWKPHYRIYLRSGNAWAESVAWAASAGLRQRGHAVPAVESRSLNLPHLGLVLAWVEVPVEARVRNGRVEAMPRTPAGTPIEGVPGRGAGSLGGSHA